MKHIDLFEKLRSRISGIEPGTRIPSVRELMRSFGVSQATVGRALETLKQDGLVFSKPGDGTYVAETASTKGPRRVATVVLAVSDYPSPFFTNVIAAVTREFEAHGLAVRGLRFSRHQRLAPLLRGSKGDAFVLLTGGGALPLLDLSAIARLPQPGVVLDVAAQLHEFDTVATDNALGGAMAARHLYELGHRRLAVLAAEAKDSPNMQSRIKGFCDQAEMMRAQSVEVIECTRPCAGPAEYAYEAMSQRIARGSVDFTGLFVVSDSTALGAIKACHDAKISLPGELSIMGFDGLAQGAFYHPALTTLRQDTDLWARTARGLIERRLAGEEFPCESHALKPELVVRESTARRRGGKKKSGGRRT